MKGIDSLLKKLNKINVNVTGVVEKSVNKGCMIVESQAKLKTPVDTGTLRRSITNSVESDKVSVKGIVGTKTHYAKYVEFGTTKQVAKPFLTPALEENKTKIQQLVIEDLKNELRKVAKK